MDLREAIYTRRAVRAYIQEPLDRELIGGLIDAAIQAPSAVNEQAWSFCVVQDQQLLARISEASKAHMLAHHQGVESRMRQMLKNPDFNIFYHAPALILISSTHRGRWAVENCALAAQNLMLAARGAGLGSCWIGFAQDWLDTPKGHAALDLPEEWLPVAPIIVGHPQQQPMAVPRRAPDARWFVGAAASQRPHSDARIEDPGRHQQEAP